MTLPDLNLERQEIVVVGKGNRERTVHFGHKTWMALDRYLRARRAHQYKNLAGVWLTPKGAMTSSGVAQMIRRRCAQAGIESIHPHQFRHTSAHNWLHQGGTEGDLMQLMGWRSRQMADRYGKSAAVERALNADERLAPGDRY